MDLPLIIVLLCLAVALWAVAGSIGTLAQRLDDQVRLHQLKLNVIQLHERFKDAALFQPLDEIDVDILPMPAGAAPPIESEPIELPAMESARKAA